MAEVSTPGAPAGTPQNPPAPPVAGTAPKEPVQPQYVSKEDFDKVLARLDGMSGSLRKLEPLTTVVAPPPPPKEPDTLTTRVKAIEDREKAVKERERLTQVRDALKAQGVDEKRATREARLLILDRGEQIQVGDDYSVTFVEGENRTGIADWVAAFLKTDEGKLINPEPAPIVPTAKGLTGTKTTTTQSPAAAAAKLTFGELINNPELYQSLRTEQPELWEQKRNEWNSTLGKKK